MTFLKFLDEFVPASPTMTTTTTRPPGIINEESERETNLFMRVTLPTVLGKRRIPNDSRR